MKEINLTQNQKTIVDDDLFEMLNKFKWCASYEPHMKKYYAFRSNERTTEYIHHYVIGKPLKGFVVDHIDGNPLNNSRNNLRIVTHRKNLQNKRINREGKLCGTSFRPHKKKRKWQACMRISGGGSKSLGYYLTEKEAHDAYMEATR